VRKERAFFRLLGSAPARTVIEEKPTAANFIRQFRGRGEPLFGSGRIVGQAIPGQALDLFSPPFRIAQ